MGACKDGYHGDAARTFAVGKISDEAQRLIDVTRESFFEGIKFYEKRSTWRKLVESTQMSPSQQSLS